MFRLVRLLVFVLCGIVAVARVATERGLTVEWEWVGVGLLIAAIVGALDMLVGNWWSTVTQPYKPQMVKMPTKETPAQITGAAMRARLIGGVLFATPVALAIVAMPNFGVGIPRDIAISLAMASFAIIFVTTFLFPMFVH